MTELPSGTVSFLFTDLEDSTRMWEEHPDAMREALARHDTILRTAIETHRGRVVKSTGDGAYAVFVMAPDAVAAAADAARAFFSEAWSATGPLRPRIGVHTGSADERDGDYFGPALNRASRLMAAAHGGQVVLSDACAELVRHSLPDDLSLRDLGEHRLRGLTRPERVHALEIAGLPSQFPPLRSLDAFPGAPVLLEPSFARDDKNFAGRGVEVDRLERAWREACGGVRQVALVSGEPGIGKTRLAGELSKRVFQLGGVVLYGRCDEESIVPYQPFVEALRPCVAAYSPSLLHERLHGLEQDLARVFPELLGRTPALVRPITSDPEAERYRLFEAITTSITGITATGPAVLILDDLQWADRPTLLLLRHLIRGVPRAALLIVACFRDVEIEQDHPLADLIADLRRESFLTRVKLGGLTDEDSGHLLRSLAGREVATPLITALHAETDGNPFFLEELLRHVMETDILSLDEADAADRIRRGSLDLPDSVREVVTRRLRRLPPVVADVLECAAVVGRDFDASLLARAAERPAETVLESLDRARDAGLVYEDASRIGRYTFSHALVRQTLNTALGTARRARLHARVGTAIEETATSEHAAAVLALHFTQAVPLVGTDKAIEYTTRAGHDALADFAFEDAVSHFERALHLLEHNAPSEARRRVELLTDLASALVYVDEVAGVEKALQAVDAARNDGSPEQFGRAVATFVEPTYGASAFPGEVTRLCDEARSVLRDRDPALRARLLAFEAFKYAAYQLHGRDGRALAEEAVALARESNDPVTLADALFALAVNLEGTSAVSGRVALGEELVALSGGAQARASAFGLRVLAGAHLERGDAEALTSAITELGRLGDQFRWLPAHVYAAQWRATQALLEGRFDDSQASGTELRRYARAYRGAAGIHVVQAYYLARERGDLRTVFPSAPSAPVDAAPSDLFTGAWFALAQLESGDETGARRNLELVADVDFRRGESESARGAALGMLAEVATRCGTREQAAALYDFLMAFEGRLLAVVLGLACIGAADRYLGMLSTVLERWDEAEAHFERALVLEERIRGHALLPRTRFWQAHFLRARRQPGDERAAQALLARVLEDASRLGMNRLRAQAEELRSR